MSYAWPPTPGFTSGEQRGEVSRAPLYLWGMPFSSLSSACWMLAALGAAAAGLLPQELSLMHIGGRQDTGNSVELPQPHLLTSSTSCSARSTVRNEFLETWTCLRTNKTKLLGAHARHEHPRGHEARQHRPPPHVVPEITLRRRGGALPAPAAAPAHLHLLLHLLLLLLLQQLLLQLLRNSSIASGPGRCCAFARRLPVLARCRVFDLIFSEAPSIPTCLTPLPLRTSRLSLLPAHTAIAQHALLLLRAPPSPSPCVGHPPRAGAADEMGAVTLVSTDELRRLGAGRTRRGRLRVARAAGAYSYGDAH
jgi:hypothetical protein